MFLSGFTMNVFSNTFDFIFRLEGVTNWLSSIFNQEKPIHIHRLRIKNIRYRKTSPVQSKKSLLLISTFDQPF